MNDLVAQGSLAELIEREAVIDRTKESAREFCEQLRQIHDRRLYLYTHGTWADYCRLRHGLGKSRGYQLLAMAALSTIVDLDNEAQARELVGLDADLQRELVRRTAAKGKVTAASLRAELIAWMNEGETEAGTHAEPKAPAPSLMTIAAKILAGLRRARSLAAAYRELPDGRALRRRLDAAVASAEKTFSLASSLASQGEPHGQS